MLSAGIDASNLRAGGGVTHLVELLRAAEPRLHGFDEVTVWGSSATLGKLDERNWLRKVHDPLLDRSLACRVFWQRFALKQRAQEAGCDVLFVPGGSDSSGFRPIVTMSQNMLPFEWREMRRYGISWTFFRLMLLRWSQSRSFQRADGLIFLTEYACDAVTKSVKRFRGSNVVVPHGINRRFRLYPRKQKVISRYSTQHPFRILYVSLVDLYKHQWQVAEAVAELRRAAFPVVIDFIGPAYPPAINRLNQVLNKLDPDGSYMRYLGSVSFETLHHAYQTSDAFVFASSCENMPNILLEAMASGLPIACSNRGPMPKVLADAGTYFDPEKPSEIANAIKLLIESPGLRTEKARIAFQRAEVFTWERCAYDTFSFLRQMATQANS